MCLRQAPPLVAEGGGAALFIIQGAALSCINNKEEHTMTVTAEMLWQEYQQLHPEDQALVRAFVAELSETRCMPACPPAHRE